MHHQVAQPHMSGLAVTGLVLQLGGTLLAGIVIWSNWRTYRLPRPSLPARAWSSLVGRLRRPREVQVAQADSVSASDSIKVEMTRGEPQNLTEAVMRVLDDRLPDLKADKAAHRALERRVDELTATVDRNDQTARTNIADLATSGALLGLLGLAMVIAGSILSAIG